MKDQGLFVEVDAEKAFVAYAKRHGKRWMAFIHKLGIDLKSASDDNSIVLVRGLVKTTAWEIGTFDSRAHSYSSTLHVAALPAAPIVMHASLSKKTRVQRQPEWHSGPARSSKLGLVGLKQFDQCVFILGVKCRVSTVLGTVKVSAEL